jgi:hypothetical protein
MTLLHAAIIGIRKSKVYRSADKDVVFWHERKNILDEMKRGRPGGGFFG